MNAGEGTKEVRRQIRQMCLTLQRNRYTKMPRGKALPSIAAIKINFKTVKNVVVVFFFLMSEILFWLCNHLVNYLQLVSHSTEMLLF